MRAKTIGAAVTGFALFLGVTTSGCAQQSTPAGAGSSGTPAPPENTATVPDDFPVPVYPNAKATSFRQGQGVDTVFLTTADSLTAVADWYEGLVKSGWTLRGETLRDEMHAVVTIAKGSITGTANIWKGPEGTDIQLHHQHQ